MNPDHGIYLGMLLRETNGVATRLEGRADGDNSRDASLFGPTQNGVEIVGKLREIQVSVCVNEHEWGWILSRKSHKLKGREIGAPTTG